MSHGLELWQIVGQTERPNGRILALLWHDGKGGGLRVGTHRAGRREGGGARGWKGGGARGWERGGDRGWERGGARGWEG